MAHCRINTAPAAQNIDKNNRNRSSWRQIVILAGYTILLYSSCSCSTTGIRLFGMGAVDAAAAPRSNSISRTKQKRDDQRRQQRLRSKPSTSRISQQLLKMGQFYGTKTCGIGSRKRSALYWGDNKSSRTKNSVQNSMRSDNVNDVYQNKPTVQKYEYLSLPMINKRTKGKNFNELYPKMYAAKNSQGGIEIIWGENNSSTTFIHGESPDGNNGVIVNTSQALNNTSASAFLPIQGVYGVFDLPHTGPVLALVVESVAVKTFTSLFPLRKVVRLDLIPLRPRSGATTGVTATVKRSEREVELLRSSLKEHGLYFATPSSWKQDDKLMKQPMNTERTDFEGGVTQCLQRRFQQTPVTAEDNRFFWNSDMIRSIPSPLVLPCCSLYLGVSDPVPLSGAPGYYRELVITRRSKYRAGTRFTKRGIDSRGHVANYAETEQLLLRYTNTTSNITSNESDEPTEVFSYVQTRGSIPLHWSSPTDVRTYRPRVRIGLNPVAQGTALVRHLRQELVYVNKQLNTSAPKGKSKKRHKRKQFQNLDDHSQTHPNLVFCNLVDKHGDQGRLGRAFDSVLNAVLVMTSSSPPTTAVLPSTFNPSFSPHNHSTATLATEKNANHRKNGPPKQETELTSQTVKHVWYDFHAECRLGYHNLIKLLRMLQPTLHHHNYFHATRSPSSLHRNSHVPAKNEHMLSINGDHWQASSVQTGVIRTNCMDCLDRTNVVQSLLGRYMLHTQLQQLSTNINSSIKPTKQNKLVMTLDSYKPLAEITHRTLWADNADVISQLYAGTPALKGDFTRTGQRTKMGALMDGKNSVTRYCWNNFWDGDRQLGMDLLTGELTGLGKDDVASLEVEEDFIEHVMEEGEDGTLQPSPLLGLHGIPSIHKNGKNKQPDLGWLPGDLKRHLQEQHPARETTESSDILPKTSRLKGGGTTIKQPSIIIGSKAAQSLVPSSLLKKINLEQLSTIDRRVNEDEPWWSLTTTNNNTSNRASITTSIQVLGMALAAWHAPLTSALVVIVAALPGLFTPQTTE